MKNYGDDPHLMREKSATMLLLLLCDSLLCYSYAECAISGAAMYRRLRAYCSLRAARAH